jgi:hypothetical protein
VLGVLEVVVFVPGHLTFLKNVEDVPLLLHHIVVMVAVTMARLAVHVKMTVACVPQPVQG